MSLEKTGNRVLMLKRQETIRRGAHFSKQARGFRGRKLDNTTVMRICLGPVQFTVPDTAQTARHGGGILNTS